MPRKQHINNTITQKTQYCQNDNTITRQQHDDNTITLKYHNITILTQ